MRVGVPSEIKVHEYRVGLTPGAVREYVARGHQVVGAIGRWRWHHVGRRCLSRGRRQNRANRRGNFRQGAT